jgi:hypothetical protein
MATRYQRVTDQIRAEVASRLDSLIWEARTDDATKETVTARRDSLAAILPWTRTGSSRTTAETTST